MNLDPSVLLQFIKPRLEKLSNIASTQEELSPDDLELVQIIAKNYLEALENPLLVAPAQSPPVGAPQQAAPPSSHRLAQAPVSAPPPPAGGGQAPGVPQVKHTRTMNERNAAALARARQKAEQAGAPPPPPFSGQDGGFADEDIPAPPPVQPRHPGMQIPQTEPPPQQIQFADDGTPLVDTSQLTVPPAGSPGNPIPDQQG